MAASAASAVAPLRRVRCQVSAAADNGSLHRHDHHLEQPQELRHGESRAGPGERRDRVEGDRVVPDRCVLDDGVVVREVPREGGRPLLGLRDQADHVGVPRDVPVLVHEDQAVGAPPPDHGADHDPQDDADRDDGERPSFEARCAVPWFDARRPRPRGGVCPVYDGRRRAPTSFEKETHCQRDRREDDDGDRGPGEVPRQPDDPGPDADGGQHPDADEWCDPDERAPAEAEGGPDQESWPPPERQDQREPRDQFHHVHQRSTSLRTSEPSAAPCSERPYAVRPTARARRDGPSGSAEAADDPSRRRSPRGRQEAVVPAGTLPKTRDDRNPDAPFPG